MRIRPLDKEVLLVNFVVRKVTQLSCHGLVTEEKTATHTMQRTRAGKAWYTSFGVGGTTQFSTCPTTPFVTVTFPSMRTSRTPFFSIQEYC